MGRDEGPEVGEVGAVHQHLRGAGRARSSRPGVRPTVTSSLLP